MMSVLKRKAKKGFEAPSQYHTPTIMKFFLFLSCRQSVNVAETNKNKTHHTENTLFRKQQQNEQVTLRK